MEHLVYSLWFTLVWWILLISASLYMMANEYGWEISINLIFVFISIPAIAILLEYLIMR